jgi:hypothetical protein
VNPTRWPPTDSVTARCNCRLVRTATSRGATASRRFRSCWRVEEATCENVGDHTDGLKDARADLFDPLPQEEWPVQVGEFGELCALSPMIPAEAVATSVAIGRNGDFYVGELKGFPGRSRVACMADPKERPLRRLQSQPALLRRVRRVHVHRRPRLRSRRHLVRGRDG